MGAGADLRVVPLVVAEDKVKGQIVEVVQHVRRDQIAGMEINIRGVGMQQRQRRARRGDVVVGIGEQSEKHEKSSVRGVADRAASPYNTTSCL